MIDYFHEILYGWENSGIAGLAVLSAVFVIASLVPVPRAALCVAGGLAFGFVAFPISLLAWTAGALLALLVSGFVLCGRALRAVEGQAVWRAVFPAVGEHSWRLHCLLCLASTVLGSVTLH